MKRKELFSTLVFVLVIVFSSIFIHAGKCVHNPLILLTNDDGVGAPGLEAIYQEVKNMGDVVIVAPAHNQSGISHRIATYEPIYIKNYRIDGEQVGYSLSTTPATCVIIALEKLLKRKPALIISGINRGINPGRVAWLSGTVAAARQGAMRGVNSIAVSLEVSPEMNYKAFAKSLRPLFEKMLEVKMPPGVFINVNAPISKSYSPAQLLVTHDSQVELEFKYQRETNIQGKELFWVKGRFPEKKYPPITDMGALQRGFIAMTFLSCNSEAMANTDALASMLNLNQLKGKPLPK